MLALEAAHLRLACAVDPADDLLADRSGHVRQSVMDRHARFKQGHGGGGDGYRSGEAAERARGSVVLHDDLGVVEGLSGQRKGEVSEAVVRLVPRVALLGAVVATPEAEADGGEGARGVVGEDEVGGLARVVDGFPATVIVVEESSQALRVSIAPWPSTMSPPSGVASTV